MATTFDTWLAKPTSHCLLRRLLDVTSPAQSAARPRRLPTIQNSRQYATAIGHDLFEDEDDTRKDLRSTKRGTQLVRKHGAVNRDEPGHDALQISLRTGVELVDPEVRPEQAFKALWHQANVASKRRLGTLKVDRPEYRQNMNLWIELLQYRQRIDGFSGIADVWKGMRYRNVDLPVVGPEADFLWPTLINACITKVFSPTHAELFESIIDHARDLNKRLGIHYAGLHKCVVGRWFRVKPSNARVWHRRLFDEIGVTTIDLRSLATDCAVLQSTLEAREVRKSFNTIHKSCPQRGLYDHFIPGMLKSGNQANALAWHRKFLSDGDGPSDEVFLRTEVQALFDSDGNKSLPMVHAIESSHQDSRMDGHAQYPPLTRASMSSLVGDVHGIKPKEASDPFVAKMFATQAFSLDLVIKGLSFFGVEKLGPLALREMAMKAENRIVFCNKLSELKAMGIRPDNSVFARVLFKVATHGPVELFETLLVSDQHPETFEDLRTQESLLASFLDNGNVHEAHIALMALSFSGLTAHGRGWNRLLQHYARNRDPAAVFQTMQQIRGSNIPLTSESLKCLRRYILPERQPGKAPIQAAQSYPNALMLNPLQFTTNAYIYAVNHGQNVHPLLWKENLKRYGMTRRWDELERLVRWLIHYYRPKRVWLKRKYGHKLGPLNIILDRQMREALVTWAFRDAADRNWLRKQPIQPIAEGKSQQPSTNGRCEPWARGLLLLKNLQSYGMPITLERVRKALLQRMWILFGPGYSSKQINEITKRNNKLHLAHYLRHANEIWDGKLFSFDPELLEDESANISNLLVPVFGYRRRVSRKRKEDADVGAFAQFIDSGRRLPLLDKKSHSFYRLQVWQRSEFRRFQFESGSASYASSDGHNHPHPRSHQSPSAHS